MSLKTSFYFVFFIFCLNAFGQSKSVEINGAKFLFTEKIDSLEEINETVDIYRGVKKILSHTTYNEEGDCSSLSIQLGNYVINRNEIIFYSYWASSDRMPNSLLVHGYRKQVYLVDKRGLITQKNGTIYIEDFVEVEDKKYFQDNGWKHKGLKYLENTPKNTTEQDILNNYIKSIEKKHNAKFVLNTEKQLLEKEVRSKLKDLIEKHTKDWVEGESYGRVKK